MAAMAGGQHYTPFSLPAPERQNLKKFSLNSIGCNWFSDDFVTFLFESHDATVENYQSLFKYYKYIH